MIQEKKYIWCEQKTSMLANICTNDEGNYLHTWRKGKLES